MPPVPLALDAVTATRGQEAAPSARSPMPMQPGDSSAKAPPLGSGRLETRDDRPPRLFGLLRRALRTGGSYYDPLFEQPDLVEDDYYRFRNQPGGW